MSPRSYSSWGLNSNFVTPRIKLFPKSFSFREWGRKHRSEEASRAVNDCRAQSHREAPGDCADLFQSWVIYTPTPFSYCLQAEYINTLAISVGPKCELHRHLGPEKAGRYRLQVLAGSSPQNEERCVASSTHAPCCTPISSHPTWSPFYRWVFKVVASNNI